MIPRRISKSTFSIGTIVALLATGLPVVLLWSVKGLPVWVRGGLSLLVAVAGLFLIFGKVHGRRASEMLVGLVHYLLRPHRWVWARAQRSLLMGVVRRPPTWWWRLVGRAMAFPLPSRQVIVAVIVASVATMLIGSVVGVNMWARANAEPAPAALPAVSANPPPGTLSLALAAPTAVPVPTSVSPTPMVAPTLVPALVHDVAIWQGGVLPGRLRLSPLAGPTMVTLVFTGTDVHTHTLWLTQDTIVPLVPAFHPAAVEVQVWSSSPVQVEQELYAPYQCPIASVWWVWIDADFRPLRLVLYLHDAGGSSVQLPDGETANLAAGRNAFPYRDGLYEVAASQPFCLEVWFEN